jgi:nucleoside-diphosphate-sugar epimerase
MTKTALVTGASGFVGRHVMAELRKRGYDVSPCDINSPMAWTMKDFNDVARWNNFTYDTVVHCAAVGAHRAAIDGQPMSFAQNMQLDAALFHWAMRTKQKRVIYISSSAVYPRDLQDILGGDHEVRLDEDIIELDNPRAPFDDYGITKLTGEHIAKAARAAGVPVTIVRPFSGYGDDQGPEWPFGAFVRRVYEKEGPFEIWGSVEQVRDWIHIDDVVNGMLAVAESGTEDPVNLCTGVGTSMEKLAYMMMSVVGNVRPVISVTDAPMGVLHRVGDPNRFFEYYEPKVTLEEGVHRALMGYDK